jgi:hypothetical protein
MANASFTYAVQTSSVTGMPMVTEDQDTITIWFTLIAAGVYVAGGIPIDFTQLFALLAAAPGASLPTAAAPLTPVHLESSRTPGQANVYAYHFVPGNPSNASNGKVQVLTGAAAQTAATELTAGALPAGVTADTISGKVTFPKM